MLPRHNGLKTWFSAAMRELGPYAAIAFVIPGGSLIALTLWAVRHRSSLARHARGLLGVLAGLAVALMLPPPTVADPQRPPDSQVSTVASLEQSKCEAPNAEQARSLGDLFFQQAAYYRGSNPRGSQSSPREADLTTHWLSL